MKKTIFILFFVVAVSQGYGQILNPALNDAFVLPKGGFQITAGYSALGVAYDGESEGYLRSLDIQLGYGVSQKVSLIARYQKAWYASEWAEGSGESFLFFGPEFQLKEDRVSFFLPVGTKFSTGEDDSYFEFTPTFNFSLPLGKKVFFNPALELGFIFCDGCSDKPWLGIDLGLGVRPNDKITFFGEYDLVYSFENFAYLVFSKSILFLANTDFISLADAMSTLPFALYVDKLSLMKDLRIILKTPWVMISGRGAI